MFHKILISLSTLLFASAAFAADPEVTFSQTHARPSVGSVGVAFFTAASTVDDAIISSSSDCCEAVEIHRSDKLNGTMSMRHVAVVPIDKKAPTRIQPDAPGGQHVMLIGLKKPLGEGDSVKVNFTFKKAPAQTVVFPVEADAATSGVHDLH